MDLIYQNFDGLDVSFQGAFPQSILEQLEAGKKEAQRQRKSVLIRLGEKQIPVLVAETGAKGGFSYRFDTGLDGEVWFAANSTKSDHWGIRVSVKSLCVALRGYYGAKEKVLALLHDLSAIGPSQTDPNTGKVVSFPKESVSRFDYCFDFWTRDSFEPEPRCFVAHARSSRQYNGKDSKNSDDSYHIGARGKVIESVRIGMMPNRQVGLYNKTKEIAAHNKGYWYEIWGEALRVRELEGRGTVWRIEARAGKEELVKWGLRTFADFEAAAGDVVVAILNSIKYVAPNNDSNPHRWPIAVFWQDAIGAAGRGLCDFRSGIQRGRIISDYRENIIKGYRDRTIGNAIGLAVAKGVPLTDLPSVLRDLGEGVASDLYRDGCLLYEKYSRVSERYSFVE